MLTPLLTPEKAAEYLGVKVKTLHGLVREGKLACVQVTPRDRKFTEAQLQEFIESRTIPMPKVVVDTKAPERLPFPRKGGVQPKSTGDFLSERAKMRSEVRSWL
jgi:excisionase family DNA binding protein